jgi:hypothetical protein
VSAVLKWTMRVAGSQRMRSKPLVTGECHKAVILPSVVGIVRAQAWWRSTAPVSVTAIFPVLSGVEALTILHDHDAVGGPNAWSSGRRPVGLRPVAKFACSTSAREAADGQGVEMVEE